MAAAVALDMSRSILFTTESIDPYRNNVLIQTIAITPDKKTQEEMYELLTYEEYKTDIIERGLNLREQLLKTTLMCRLNGDYCSTTISNLMNDYGTFDALFAVNKRTAEVDGFIITQLGECKAKPDTYAVNLICAQSPCKAIVLLGACLYCVKQKGGREVILELADNYKNPSGLLLYIQLFFDVDMEMLRPNCFFDIQAHTLPMTCRLDQFTNAETIISYVAKLPSSIRPVESIVDPVSREYYEKYLAKDKINPKTIDKKYKNYNDFIWCRTIQSLSEDEIPAETIVDMKKHVPSACLPKFLRFRALGSKQKRKFHKKSKVTTHRKKRSPRSYSKK